mgnify:CR=1 FL=1
MTYSNNNYVPNIPIEQQDFPHSHQFHVNLVENFSFGTKRDSSFMFINNNESLINILIF